MRKNSDTQTEQTEALIRYLNCPCRYFAPMADDDPIMEAYREARERGEKEGFLPVLVTVDETLWECLIMNSDEDSDGGEAYEFQAGEIAKYRRKLLAAPLKSGAEVTELLLKTRMEEADDDELDWDEDVMGQMEGGEPNDRFCGYWDYGTDDTCPLILAEIPVENPWEIFAYLPFGNWNECPDTPELMAVAKYWFEKHGAVPAVMTHDVLEFDVPEPVSREQATRLALEQYAWCPDVVDQGPEDCTVGLLADSLAKSKVWYFWWD